MYAYKQEHRSHSKDVPSRCLQAQQQVYAYENEARLPGPPTAQRAADCKTAAEEWRRKRTATQANFEAAKTRWAQAAKL